MQRSGWRRRSGGEYLVPAGSGGQVDSALSHPACASAFVVVQWREPLVSVWVSDYPDGGQSEEDASSVRRGTRCLV